MKRIAVYPGSFDPVTVGHLDVIRRASKLFDELIVLVSKNIMKSNESFTPQERVSMITRVTTDLPNVRVDLSGGLLVDYVRDVHAIAIVKGLRAVSDFEYEFQMALMNNQLDCEIETLFMTTAAANSFLSSSSVKRFAVVGSDARQAAAGRALARAGYTVGGVQQLPQADCILLPLPLEQADLPLAQLLGAAKPGALALGGKVTDSARTIARAAGVELVDYFARPELTVYNAIPTAEGCIGILLERRSRTLWGAAVLVLGFGPVGRALAVRLAALGARVTVAARRPVQRAMAEELGLRAVPLTELAAAAAAFDTVVNTIPAPVLTAQVLAALPKKSLIVDLASKPGGTDFAAARRLGHTALHALSLPTVWAPETAGEALARTVQAILQEREGTV